ncbi:RPA family protein [Halocatena salina]|uniref:DNA-binding protein n=1 Tax=Halocatena salina TaxID=2934340 RepID=A0A8U0A537_9EURY|nr:DNA-binding protein [Halocatena salina]UPM43976.1 DNA-binding protein [Halocatena salina]
MSDERSNDDIDYSGSNADSDSTGTDETESNARQGSPDTTNTDNSDTGGQRRQVARRVFASEFNDATYTFKESNEDRAPVYALLPTGERANRVFIAGTLTETQDVGSESEYWQGRVVDPSGTFFVYAGQYQPEAATVLREAEPPVYVSIVGKPRTYETDDGAVNVSLRPESISITDAETRDRWVVETALRTVERAADTETDPTEYDQMAAERYERSPEQYKQDAIGVLEELDADTETQTADPTP